MNNFLVSFERPALFQLWTEIKQLPEKDEDLRMELRKGWKNEETSVFLYYCFGRAFSYEHSSSIWTNQCYENHIAYWYGRFNI